jgi:L-cysteate sulfo-lyase
MHLARFPRFRLGHLPTPLEPMPSLSERLGGPRLYVKRDDCTGLATGGNKARKLEFLIAAALEADADTVITHGAVQSNHVRQTAAAANRAGLACAALLERRVPDRAAGYEATGNVLLDRLLGARLRFVPAGTDMDLACAALAEEIEAEGGRPYIIPGGGSNPTGALGYVNAALEMLQQANDHGLRIDAVVHASGSTGTQAGLVCGLAGAGCRIPVLGISVRQQKLRQEEAVWRLACATAAHLGLRHGIDRSEVVVNSDHVGPGYGLPSEGTLDAIRLAAATEGLLLDPVYTGKAMAGLIELVRQGEFSARDHVVFVHTGGAAGLFAYEAELAEG